MTDKKDQAAAPIHAAFLCLGVMGYPMAGHLVKAGHTVTVYNRNSEKAQRWVKEFGGTAAATPREAVSGADVVMICAGNDDDVRSVLYGEEGAIAGMKPGAVLVDHTTDSATLARELDDCLAKKGLGFVDAPVSGGQSGAEQGVLTIMCGAKPEVFARVKPVLEAYACAVTLMGEVGSGQLTKMVNQICIAGVVQGLSEALAFGMNAGLDMDKVLGVITKGAAGSWQMANRGSTMVRGQFNFGFAVHWMRKDLSIALEEARRNGSSLPATALVDALYAQVQAHGGGRWDTSSLITLLPHKEQGTN